MNLAMTRSRFLDNAVATAGPQRILVMLYDRLALDIDRAELAQRAGDRSAGCSSASPATAIATGCTSPSRKTNLLTTISSLDIINSLHWH